jgi:hypothetical protein
MEVPMKQSFLPMLIGLGFALGGAPAWAQSKNTDNTLKLDDPKLRPPARITDVAWLAGRWMGDGPNGTFEDCWGPPLGNNMIGTFRLVKDGKVVFSELLFIVEEEGSLVMMLKHFDAEFRGWEEKDASIRFPLVKLTDAAVYFDGLTYRRLADGSLEAFVAVKKDGKTQELSFKYRRAPAE